VEPNPTLSATVDIEFCDATFLDDDVVETESTNARAGSEPVATARLDVGVARIVAAGDGYQTFPELKAQVVALRPLLAAYLLLLAKLDLIFLSHCMVGGGWRIRGNFSFR
jgi:hypothetical protein